jgi:hypothetical protein
MSRHVLKNDVFSVIFKLNNIVHQQLIKKFKCCFVSNLYVTKIWLAPCQYFPNCPVRRQLECYAHVYTMRTRTMYGHACRQACQGYTPMCTGCVNISSEVSLTPHVSPKPVICTLLRRVSFMYWSSENSTKKPAAATVAIRQYLLSDTWRDAVTVRMLFSMFSSYSRLDGGCSTDLRLDTSAKGGFITILSKPTANSGFCQRYVYKY